MRVLVGLSGGVDSAVSALLLKEAGHEVSAGFMINYLADDESCPTRVDLEEAKKVAAFLGIPFHTFDFTLEYEKRIVEYIYREYDAGRTPNPDVFCNNLIKFDLFAQEAVSYGFEKVAMGHYARIVKSEIWSLKWEQLLDANCVLNSHLTSHISHLCKGLDPTKDQSYFLARLSQEQISRALFPIGHLLKSEVREIASHANLPNALRKDSQGLCFIGKVPMAEFLAKRLQKNPGRILDTSGKVLGEHLWLWYYTLGQRKGIDIGGGPALYVVEKNIQNNELIVGEVNDSRLFVHEVSAIDFRSIGAIPHGKFRACAKLRYRQSDQDATFEIINGVVHAVFDTSQRAPTPWQILVVYDGERVVGSGIIE